MTQNKQYKQSVQQSAQQSAQHAGPGPVPPRPVAGEPHPDSPLGRQIALARQAAQRRQVASTINACGTLEGTCKAKLSEVEGEKPRLLSLHLKRGRARQVDVSTWLADHVKAAQAAGLKLQVTVSSAAGVIYQRSEAVEVEEPVTDASGKPLKACARYRQGPISLTDTLQRLQGKDIKLSVIAS